VVPRAHAAEGLKKPRTDNTNTHAGLIEKFSPSKRPSPNSAGSNGITNDDKATLPNGRGSDRRSGNSNQSRDRVPSGSGAFRPSDLQHGVGVRREAVAQARASAVTERSTVVTVVLSNRSPI